MSKFFRHIILLCGMMIFILPNASYATHVVGGTISYRCLGNDTYELTLTVRRDCLFGDEDAQFDDPASIGIFDAFGNLQANIGGFGQIIIPFMSSDTIVDDLNDNCNFSGNGVCVHETTYIGTVVLPNNGFDYVLSYQRCCRNGSLDNIEDPLTVGSTYSVTLTTGAMESCNNSPTFNQWHDIYACANQILSFDHSASDPEGDSLVYRLCTPKDGATFDDPFPQPPAGPPYEDVPFANGFSMTDMLGSSVPLTIDPNTGVLEALPQILGQYLVGICVDEYRDGVLLSTTTRDFEINVIPCMAPFNANFSYTQPDCEIPTVAFSNLNPQADNYQWSFDFPNNTMGFSSTDPNPIFDYPAAGSYVVEMIATRSSDGCTATNYDTIVVTDMDLVGDFELSVLSCGLDSFSVQLNDLTDGLNPISIDSWLWIYEYGSSTITASGDPMQTVSFPYGEDISITLLATAENGCNVSIIKEFEEGELLPSADFNIMLESCQNNGFQLAISAITDGMGSDPVSWDWTIQDSNGANIATGPSIMADVVMGDFSVSLDVVFDNGCSASISRDLNTDDLNPILGFDLLKEGCRTEPAGQTVDAYIFDEFTVLPILDSVLVDVTELAYEWTINVDGNIFTYTDVEPTFTIPDGSQLVMVNLTVSYRDCQFEFSEEFNELDFGSHGFDISITECNGDSVTVQIIDQSVFFAGIPFEDRSVLVYEAPFDEIFYNGGDSIITFNLDPNQIETIIIEYVYNYESSFPLLSACPLSIDSTIQIADLLPQSNIIVEQTQCDGDLVYYTVSASSDPASNPVAYSWTYQIGANSFTETQSSFDIVAEMGDPLVFDLEVTYENQCAFPAEQVSFTAQGPSIEFNGNTIVPCQGDSAALLSNYNPDWSYTWSPLTGLSFPDGPGTNPVVATSIPAAYSVTVSDGFCETTGDIEVDPDADFMIDISVSKSCEDNPNTLGQDLDYLLTPNLNGINANIISIQWEVRTNGGPSVESTTDSININAINGDEFDVVLSIEFDNGCSATSNNLIFEAQLPSIEFISDPIIVGCGEDSVQMVLNPNPDFDYVWTPTNGLIFINGDMSNPLVSITDDMTYIVAITDDQCITMDTIDVMVEDGADFNFDNILGSTQICSNELFLYVEDADPNITYEWSDVSDFSNIIFGATDTLRYTISDPFTDFTIYIRANHQNGCVTNQDTSITVSNASIMLDYDKEITACAGDSILVELTNLDPNQMLTFNLMDSHIVAGENTGSIIIAIDDSDMDFNIPFSVENQFGCILEDTLMISIDERMQLDFDYDLEDCDGYTICFDALMLNGGAANWDFGDPNTDTDFALDNPTPCYDYPEAGTYIVTLSEDLEACAGIPIQKMIVVPEILELTTTLDTLTYQGDTTLILTAQSNGVDTIQWCAADGTNIGQGDTLFYVPSGTTDVFAKVVSQFGCTDSVSIHVMEFTGFMDFDLTSNLDNDIACPGEPFRLEVQSNMDLSTFTFMWFPADCILEDADTANPLVVADETKDFNVVISEAGMGFDTTLTITVTVDPPTVEIISSEGDSVFLSGSTTLSVIDPDAGSTYDWSTGESGVSIDITPEESGVYIVTVTDENGCTATDEYSLTVINPRCTEEDVFLPTAFSPNGDGNNDIYRVRSNFIKEMELTVFNRWGQQLFISTDPDIGWDGTYEGELLGPDAFAYCLKVTCVNDVEYVKAGSLSLLR